jgi:hypothetical protein
MSSKDFQGSLSEVSEKVPKETWQVKSVGAEGRVSGDEGQETSVE